MRIGIYPHEKVAPQRVILDIEAECALPEIMAEDINQTVSYETFVTMAREIAERRHYDLIEIFCHDVMEALWEDARILRLMLQVEKPDVFKGNPESAGVRLSWRR